MPRLWQIDALLAQIAFIMYTINCVFLFLFFFTCRFCPPLCGRQTEEGVFQRLRCSCWQKWKGAGELLSTNNLRGWEKKWFIMAANVQGLSAGRWERARWVSANSWRHDVCSKPEFWIYNQNLLSDSILWAPLVALFSFDAARRNKDSGFHSERKWNWLPKKEINKFTISEWEILNWKYKKRLVILGTTKVTRFLFLRLR